MTEPLVTDVTGTSFVNWHRTRDVGGPVGAVRTPHNLWVDGTSQADRPFLPGLHGLRRIIEDAAAGGQVVRAIGSGWGLSNSGYSRDVMVNTTRLTKWAIGFQTDHFLEPHVTREQRDRLVWAQCGLQIKNINAYLEARRLSLRTSGASNGQTIAGACSTGTHGAAIRVGSLHDTVVGLHLLGPPGRSIWLEPARRPFATAAFASHLDAELRRDDALFDAALVSFGSFGVVHAVMFEVDPIYTLALHIRNIDADRAGPILSNLDLSGLGLPAGEPYHIEVVINPYRLGAGERGAYVRTYYRNDDVIDPLPPRNPREVRTIQSADLVSLVSILADVVPEAVPGIVTDMLRDEFKETPPDGIVRTHGQHFGDSSLVGPGLSAELGLPLDHANAAANIVVAAALEAKFAGVMAFRFVKASRASLAFTKFEPITCTLELPGIDSHRNRDFLQKVFDRLQEAHIPHTYHWGQALAERPDWIVNAFGPARQAWLDARAAWLGDAGDRLFSTDFLRRLGLAFARP